MAKKSSSGGLVYSTEFGRACPECREPQDQCRCSKAELADTDGIVRVSRESKGRGGKVVTVISGVPLPGAELKTLAKELKQKCGVGGALKDGLIEIQGDQRDLLVSELSKRGFTVKKAGG